MARWGEGDPRWLVQERGDGVNVNGWHWEERDRMAWAKQRIGELLVGLAVSTSPLLAELSVRKIESVAGEAAVSQRKGTKKLAVYDLTLELEWSGRMSGSEEDVVGKMKITEFASHSDEDDLIIDCTKVGSTSDADWALGCPWLECRSCSTPPDKGAMCQLARSKLQPAIINALRTFPADMLATYESDRSQNLD